MGRLFNRNRSRHGNVDTDDSGSDLLVATHDVTWTCHVCGDVRPDDKISVLSKSNIWSNGIKVTQNIRYCNDRPECENGAPNIEFIET